MGLLSRFTRPISKVLDYNEFCANEGTSNLRKQPYFFCFRTLRDEGNFGKKTCLDVDKLNNTDFLKPTETK